jgi:hypothetical protein
LEYLLVAGVVIIMVIGAMVFLGGTGSDIANTSTDTYDHIREYIHATNLCGDGRCDDEETSESCPEDCFPVACSDFCLFTKPIFDYVLPDTLPERGEILEELSIFASPSEFEPATFVIYSKDGLPDVTVRSTELSNGSDIIPTENIDIRVVKVWEQAGYDLKKTGSVLVPELLVYDDSEDLTTPGYSCGVYTPPSISSNLRTDIPANTSKQFWITVEIPDSASPGDYKGELSIASEGTTLTELPFSVDVLPITLLEPEQKHLIFYRSFSSYRPQSEEITRKQLQDMKKHGIKGFLIEPKTVTDLSDILKLAEQYGFEGPVIPRYDVMQHYHINHGLKFNFTSAVAAFGGTHYAPYFYGTDECNNMPKLAGGGGYYGHINISYIIHSEGAEVSTSLLKQTADELADPNSIIYDYTNPDTGKSYREMGITNEGLNHSNYHSTYLYLDDIGVDLH